VKASLKTILANRRVLKEHLDQPPGIVRNLEAVTGQEVAYTVEAEVKVNGVTVEFKRSKFGEVTARYLLYYPDELAEALRNNAGSDDSYLEEWLEREGFMEQLEKLGYSASEEIEEDTADVYSISWGDGVAMHLLDCVTSVLTALAKIKADVPCIKKMFDSLCAKAVKEYA
jgi:hypothetical protein